jgi:hypothetical protein
MPNNLIINQLVVSHTSQHIASKAIQIQHSPTDNQSIISLNVYYCTCTGVVLVGFDNDVAVDRDLRKSRAICFLCLK